MCLKDVTGSGRSVPQAEDRVDVQKRLAIHEGDVPDDRCYLGLFADRDRLIFPGLAVEVGQRRAADCPDRGQGAADRSFLFGECEKPSITSRPMSKASR